MEAGRESTFVHREVQALVLLTVAAVAAFFLTRTVAHANRDRRRADAREWAARGAGALRAGQAAPASAALRRATVLDPANVSYRIQLAEALTAERSDAAARQTLLDVLATDPRNVDVNLALGRLEAPGGDVDRVVRYYQTALEEMWTPAGATTRYEVRSELARYLIAHGQRSRALSEVLILSTEAPDSAAAHAAVARLFVDSGDASRALPQFDRALALDPSNEEVRLAGAQAAFSLGDDRRALGYLRSASREAARDLSATITTVLSSDPLAPRLTAAERERRLRLGIARAAERAGTCPSPPPSADALYAFEATLSATGTRRVPVSDVVDDGVELVTKIEHETAACAPVTTIDRALTVIGARHEGSR